MSRNAVDLKKTYLAKVKNLPGSNMNRNAVDLKKTYLAIIKNSLGSKMFQSLYIYKDKKKNESIDIMHEGQFSCAFFVSYILYSFDLINSTHATVKGLKEDIQNFGWEEIEDVKKGSIIFWEKLRRNGTTNAHVGFYIGNKQAISNSSEKGVIDKNHFTYGEKGDPKYRKIEHIFWHHNLD